MATSNKLPSELVQLIASSLVLAISIPCSGVFQLRNLIAREEADKLLKLVHRTDTEQYNRNDGMRYDLFELFRALYFCFVCLIGVCLFVSRC
jgi:hypothetical protein